MARGFVRKRGERWYAYWRDPAGRQRSKAVSARKKDAEAFLARIDADLTEGTYCEVRQIGFEAFARLWLDDYAAVHVKPSTLRSYTYAVNSSLVPYFGPYKLSEIGTAQVQSYVAHLSRTKRSAGTVDKHLVILKGMLKQAVMWGFLRHNPATVVKGPRPPHREMAFLTPSQIAPFLAAIQPEFYRPLFATAVLTGMRLGELLGLQWGDIDWNGGTIRVRRSMWNNQFQEPKSSRSVRNVVMTATLASILVAHKTVAPANVDDLVFTTPQGNHIRYFDLRAGVFHPSLLRAGLPVMRIHDLRHTFASLLIDQGENLKFVQQQLGHASIQTTVDRYGHLMPDAHIGASQRLDAAVFGTRPETDDRMLTQAPDGDRRGEPATLLPAAEQTATAAATV